MPVPSAQNHYTFAACLTWGANERTEIINGESGIEIIKWDAVMMAPPSRTHQEVSGALFAQLYAFLEGKKCRVYSAPFAVRLFEKDGDTPEDVDTMVEPDISVVCDSSKLDDAGCKGAPDLVMEILSPSTMRHDRFTKFNLYQRAGVREYWIVDPSSKSVQVFVLEAGNYKAQDFGTVGDIIKVNVLDGCFIELSKVFPGE